MLCLAQADFERATLAVQPCSIVNGSQTSGELSLRLHPVKGAPWSATDQLPLGVKASASLFCLIECIQLVVIESSIESPIESPTLEASILGIVNSGLRARGIPDSKTLDV